MEKLFKGLVMTGYEWVVDITAKVNTLGTVNTWLIENEVLKQ